MIHAAVGAVLVSLMSAGVARAQALEAPPVVPVEIAAGEDAAFVQLQGPTGPIACGTRCSLQLPQGRYRLLVRDADGHLSAEWLPVLQPTHLTVTPASRGARIAGIVVMGTGIAVAGVGAFVLWAMLISQTGDCFGDCGERWPRGRLYGGLITLTAGAALGVTGLVIWRRNVHAVVDEAPPAERAQVLLSPITTRDTMGLALTGRF